MPNVPIRNQQNQREDQTNLPPAHSLRDAANTDNTLEGYAAMNDVPRDSAITEEVLQYPYDEHSEISMLAFQYYLERGGHHGSHEDDWYRAEREIRSRRQPNHGGNTVTATTNKTVVGVFNSVQDAKSAVSALENAGFSRDDISVIANKNIAGSSDAAVRDVDTGTGEKTSAVASDAGIGAALGGIGGLLWSFAALAIPGVGPVLALGPLAAALGGAGIGAVAGGIIGALTETGIPEEEAHGYAEVVRRGQVLVTVRTDDARADRARDILDQYGAIDMENRTTEWRQQGWKGYDPGAEPLSADELRREREYYGSTSSSNPNRGWTPREVEGSAPALRDASTYPHKEAYPQDEAYPTDAARREMDDNLGGTFGDATTLNRPTDPVSVRVEKGFDRAKESAVQSARRLGSRVYDVTRRP